MPQLIAFSTRANSGFTEPSDELRERDVVAFRIGEPDNFVSAGCGPDPVQVLIHPVIPGEDSQGRDGLLIKFTPDGGVALADVSRRLISLPTPRNQLAIVLDNEVVMAPAIQAALTDSRVEIRPGGEPMKGDVVGRISAAIPLHLRLTETIELHGN